MDSSVTGPGPLGKDEGYDVSDPTDWLGTPLSSLMQVEQSLRCHVCKDFFNSPMMTTCCHTFCSLCIRRALNSDGKCPLCRATDQESKLRRNGAITEAVDAFVASRAVMLSLARRPAQTETAAAPSATSKRKAEAGTDGEDLTSKRTRMSTRSSSARAAAVAAATPTALSEPVTESANGVEVEESILDDGLVACPICEWRMKPEKVDRHLDTDCPGQPQPQPQPHPSRTRPYITSSARSSHTPPAAVVDRLPSTNYSILNETKLRRKLTDLGIPSWGPRLLLEKRHREWVMIWNANCDSRRPKTKRELLQELDTWERTQGGHAPTMSLSAHLGAQIRDKDFDGAGWSAKHNGSFNDLISQARRSQTKSNNEESSHSDLPMQGRKQSKQSEENDTTPLALVSVTGIPGKVPHHDRPAVSTEGAAQLTTDEVKSAVKGNGGAHLPSDGQIIPDEKVLTYPAVAETPI